MPPIPKMEIRNLATRIEIRGDAGPDDEAESPAEAEAEASKRTLVGYASRFNDPFRPFLDWADYIEIVHPDAFTRTLREMPDVLALRNHDTDRVLGRGASGTLRLKVDRVGLAFEVDLNLDTTVGRDTQADVLRGDIRGCSIGFCCVVDDVVTDRDTGAITRTILDADLYEITPACTFPANPATDVSLRSAIVSRVRARSRPAPITLHRPNSQLIEIIRRRRGR